MASRGIDAAIGRFGGLLDRGAVADLPDGPLLDRYLSGRPGESEMAFEVLVVRHGPMVLRVCRGVLRDPHDAQDAFQATFLVLARRARSIRRPDSAASWLHGVARRVALKARAGLARRRRHEGRFASMMAEASAPDGDRDDLRALDEEVARLPAAIRAAVVLCYLEGMTYEVAAGQLGVTEGTVRGRLARARDRLRGRLARRGLASPAWLAAGDAPAPPPAPGLADAAVRIATGLAAGRAAPSSAPTSVAALAEGVLRTMIMTRAIRTAAALLALAIPATGAFVLAQREPGPRPQPPAVKRAADPAARPPASGAAPDGPEALRHGDGKPDGKKSLGGSGEMVEFTLPGEGRKLAGVRIHASRYGQAAPPEESFLIYFLSGDQSEVLATRMAPYALLERGPERWVELDFARPVEVSGRFWVALDFRAHQSKGAYLSFDSSTGGKFSRAGLPGLKPREVDYGDWMIELTPAR